MEDASDTISGCWSSWAVVMRASCDLLKPFPTIPKRGMLLRAEVGPGLALTLTLTLSLLLKSRSLSFLSVE